MNKKITGFGVGSASIIMIFIVLCLTTFSLLSYSSSTTSLKFANKAKDYAQLNANAEEKANRTLAEIDSALFSAKDNILGYDDAVLNLKSISGVKVVPSPDGYKVTYSVKITENNSLQVELKVPASPSAKRYEIVKWNTVTSERNYNNGENVWDGKTLQ